MKISILGILLIFSTNIFALNIKCKAKLVIGFDTITELTDFNFDLNPQSYEDKKINLGNIEGKKLSLHFISKPDRLTLHLKESSDSSNSRAGILALGQLYLTGKSYFSYSLNSAKDFWLGCHSK